MGRSTTALFGGLGLAFALVASGACRDATQITVEVTTDVKCSDLRGTTFTVGELANLDERPTTTVSSTCDPARARIGSLVIVPSGANDDVVAIRVVAGLGKDPSECAPSSPGSGCIVARRALRFVPHRSLTLPIVLAASCEGVACGATETCVRGLCRNATIPDPEACTDPSGCGENVLAPGDGGVDAAPEAAVDAEAGRCDNGACVPVILATGQTGADTVVLDSATLYWANRRLGGEVMRAPAAGGAATALATGLALPYAVAFDSASVYYATENDPNGAVYRVPKTGGASVALATGLREPHRLATDGTSVFWVDTLAGTVMKIAAGGGAPTTLASGQAMPKGIAVDGTHVYWVNHGDGKINRIVKSGGAAAVPVQLAVAKGAGPIRIVVDAERAYWSTYDGGTVESVPLGGGAVTTLATGQGIVSGITRDAQYVYWATYTTPGFIRKTPLGGGEIITLASDQDMPVGLAVDGTFIYWANTGTGTIVRVAK